MTAVDKTEWIKRRARQLWEAEGLASDREQACWEKAVQEIEAGTPEEQRGPVQPDPAIGSDSDTTPKKP